MHKAIVFDLGKVLIPFDFQLGYRALESFCRYPAPEIRRRIGSTGLVGPFEKGLIDPRDFVAQLSAALDLDLDYEAFCRAWGCIFTGQLIPDSLLEGLAARYRLLLLSNTNLIHFRIIRENYSSLLRHFHDLVLSFEVHAAKPEPEIFQTAIERAGCLPQECLFTDDIADNVEAARLVGMDAVQFQSPQQLQDEMSGRGIVW
jgi:FMN phosphatase YigB (HAD superfamily)